MAEKKKILFLNLLKHRGLRKIGGEEGRKRGEKWWSGQLAIVQLTREPPPLGENHLAGCISRPTKIRSRVRTRFRQRVEKKRKKEEEKKKLLATPVSIHGTWGGT